MSGYKRAGPVPGEFGSMGSGGGEAVSELRMNAYYYAFSPTGVPEIDMILSAVACAGKAYHHTEDWRDQCEWPPHEGNSPAEWIQRAAEKAAIAMKKLQVPRP